MKMGIRRFDDLDSVLFKSTLLELLALEGISSICIAYIPKY